MSYLKKHKGGQVNYLGPFTDFLVVLEEAYDPEIPLTRRVQQLGESLQETHKFLTVDRELLAWAAAARFLLRKRTYELATFALRRYEGLSLALSDGALKDVLDLFPPDVFPKQSVA